jgi:myo-inositol-1(or 4)-monophosphatase
MSYSNYLPSMKTAALASGKMLLKAQSKSSEVIQDYKDFVTEQDFLAEKMISESLRETFPSIQVYGEEGTGEANPKSFPLKGIFWVIDPIDGTVQYFKGKEKWGVSIALVEDGVTVAAVVYLPTMGQLFSASLDLKTQMQQVHLRDEYLSEPTLIQITPESDIKRCTFVIDYGKPGFMEPENNPFWQTMEKLRRRNIHDDGGGTSCVFQMMLLVLGKVGAFIFQPDHFDAAAAGLIVKQAGGRVSNFEGEEWQSFQPQILASNGAIHDELLKIVQEPL